MILMEEQLLTVEEVAQRLRKRPFTVRRMLRDGELPAYKIHGEWRVKSRDLDRFIEAQQYQKPEES